MENCIGIMFEGFYIYHSESYNLLAALIPDSITRQDILNFILHFILSQILFL